MQSFQVYHLLPIEPVKAQGVYLWDKKGEKYLDLYGGHAVISIGHSHPHYIQSLKEQLEKIAFYSNSIENPLQEILAEKLGKLSGYENYHLFFCNSGAEANENALKLASFHNQKKKVLAFSRSFHGRTSAAVAITDNPKIIAPINSNHEVQLLAWEDLESLENELKKENVSAVVLEGIQGVGGIYVPSDTFLKGISALCKKYATVFILDEIQSGYGRSGKFFAHQYAAIQPDLITVAKGMGNGFPIGGVLISPQFEAKEGMLGTTFGGNHLACAASIAVLEVIEKENLVENALKTGTYLLEKLHKFPQIKEIRGKGLMIGLEFDFDITQLRNKLLFEHHIFTGYAGKKVLRLLPPLSLTIEEADIFLEALEQCLALENKAF